MKYDGSSWMPVGSAAFSTGDVWYCSIAIDRSGVPYVAYTNIGDSAISDSFNATVMKFNGNGWVTVGSPVISVGGVRYTTMAIDNSGTPYVAYMNYDWANSTGGGLTVMKYDGSSWVYEGIGGKMGGQPSITLDRSGTPYLVFSDNSDSSYRFQATVMKLARTNSIKNISGHTTHPIVIYPDPNCGSFTVYVSSAENQNARIIITNMAGQKVKECTLPVNKNVNMQVDGPPGIYLITLKGSDGIRTEKFVKI